MICDNEGLDSALLDPRLRNVASPTRENELAMEARYLHRAFFGSDPPSEVVDRYIAANLICRCETDALTSAIVARRLDAEAIELTMRLRHGPTILTRKIRILFYLLEVRSAYYPFFVGGGESRFRALSGVLYAALPTAVKYLKGAYLVRKHGLV
jgi:hypothetical protein